MTQDRKQVQRGSRVEPLPAEQLFASQPLSDRLAAGKALRGRVPREAHADWSAAPDRPDPIALLEEQGKDRLQDLVPVRYGRMVTSPFAFLRGSAIVMAEDLAGTPHTGLTVQACGDAHLSNFGIFATPERNIVFDLNDFDETLPGPWEWDVKRLAASFAVVGRHRGLTASERRNSVLEMIRTYGKRMREFASMRRIDVWYSRIDIEPVIESMRSGMRKRTERDLEKARLRDHLQAQARLTEVVDHERRIKDDPPLVVRLEDDAFRDQEFVRRTFEDYLRTLPNDRRHLLSQYRFVDAGIKVVGVGSVGTRCFMVLLQGRDDGDPLFLQIKEATASVLEPHLRKSRYRNHAQRVVEGQRLMQAASDIVLGWTRGRTDDRDYYWRQLRDVKGSIDPETIRAPGLVGYGKLCGHGLARAHARSGDAAAIAGYVGTGAAFPEAIATFAEAYADQTERDHAVLLDAARSGLIEIREGV
jgi:uncharacterized protein (DUF2252 family)